MGARLAREQRREVSRINQALPTAIRCPAVVRHARAVAPEPDALTMDAHGHRRADMGDGHRVPVAQHRDEGLGGDLAGQKQPVIVGRGGQRPALRRFLHQPGQRRHARRRRGTPVADEGRVLAPSCQASAWSRRSASSLTTRPARKLPLTHLTSDSTLPF